MLTSPPMPVCGSGFADSYFTSEVCIIFASIIIVVLAILFGSLSIVAQYTKDRERRKKIEGLVSIPAALALFCTIFWLMSHAHQLDDLGVSPFALEMVLVFFLLIPALTYIFSPAFKDSQEEGPRHPQVHSQDHTTRSVQPVPYQQRTAASPNPCRSVVAVRADDTFIMDGVVMDEVDDHAQFLLE